LAIVFKKLLKSQNNHEINYLKFVILKKIINSLKNFSGRRIGDESLAALCVVIGNLTKL
jgi:hypothetical protein